MAKVLILIHMDPRKDGADQALNAIVSCQVGGRDDV